MTATTVDIEDTAAAAAEPTATKGRVAAHDLCTVLSDVLAFTAAPLARVPALEAVRIEAGGSHLIAVATDRFTLGVSRVAYDGPACEGVIAARDAANLARLAKTAKRDQGWREAVITHGSGGMTVRFTSGEAQTMPWHQDSQFPAWRHLIPECDEQMGAAIGVTYDPVLLGRFAKVRSAEQGRRMTMFPAMAQGRVRPTAVRIGDDFIGMIMPIGPSEAPYEMPAWLPSGKGR